MTKAGERLIAGMREAAAATLLIVIDQNPDAVESALAAA